MSLVHSPKITTNSLVFAYDLSNPYKSFKGAPTTNLAPANQRTGSTALTRQISHIETYTYTPNVEAYGRKDTIKIEITPTGTGTNPYCDFGFQAYRTGGSQIGDVYWISFDYKNIKGGSNPSCGIAYADGYKVPDANNVGTFSDISVIDLPDGWRRFRTKCTLTAAGNTHWRFGQNSADEVVEFYVDNFQVEYASAASPFVDGVRSATASVFDWKSNNNITSTNMVNDIDDTPRFDTASASRLTSTTPSITMNAHSVELWFNPSSSGGLYTTYNGDTNRIRLSYNFTNQNFTFFSGYSGQDGGPLSFGTPTNSVPPNTWSHVVTTMDFLSGNFFVYVNGELSTVIGANPLSAPNAVGEMCIGCLKDFDDPLDYQSHITGRIDVVKVYNKILSQAEVKQNFNALRARYGL